MSSENENKPDTTSTVEAGRMSGFTASSPKQKYVMEIWDKAKSSLYWALIELELTDEEYLTLQRVLTRAGLKDTGIGKDAIFVYSKEFLAEASE